MANPLHPETAPATIYEAFRRQVMARPDAEALVFPDVRFTYAQLDRLVSTFAYKLAQENGAGPGSLLMLHSNELTTVVSFFLAASAIGAAIVERNDELIVPQGYQLTHHFHTGVTKGSYPPASRRIDEEWSPARLNADLPGPAAFAADSDFFFTFSSGTTGLPKVIPLSHDAVLRRSLAAGYDFKPGETRFAAILPVGSRPFMARALGALVNGAAIVDGTDSTFWLAVGVNLVSGSATQMKGYFAKTALARRIREGEVLGSRLLPRDALLLLNAFETVQDTIGASEASKFHVNRHTLDAQGRLLSRGESLDSEVEVIDVVSGQPTRSSEGSLRVRNAYLAKRYIGDEAASQQSFRDGWFWTGDSARWGADNLLDVSERTNNVINIGGNKIHAALIDRVLRSTRGIRDAISFRNPKPGADEEVFAFVIFEEGVNQLQAMEVARLRVEELLGRPFVPRVIRGVAGLPRLEDGTADRQACARFILELAQARGSSPPA